MRKLFFFLCLCCVWFSYSAVTIAIVTKKSGSDYDAVKNSIIQSCMASGIAQETVVLAGDSGDDSLLSGLAAKNPDIAITIGPAATKKTREGLPSVWIVYTMVYYPQQFGFNNDPKMVGIDSLGPVELLINALKSLDRRVTSLAIIYSSALSNSISKIVGNLQGTGFSVSIEPINSEKDLPSAFNRIKTKTRALLILPDPTITSRESIQFLISGCASEHIIPCSLTEDPVGDGILVGAFFRTKEVGLTAFQTAQKIISTKKSEQWVKPSKGAIALNKTTLKSFGFQKFSMPVEVAYE